MRSAVVAGLALAVVAAVPAMGADLPVKAPRVVPVAVYNWTGCYLGIEGGGNWGTSQHIADDPVRNPAAVGLAQTDRFNLSGAMIGGTVGCNYQATNNFMFGLEGDLSWTNKSGSSPLIPPFNTTETASTSESWLATVRGRIGYTFDRLLIFGTGGLAIAEEKFQLSDPVTGFGGSSKTATGWVAGAGFEYAFWSNWSAKLEYLHVDLGRTTFPFAPNSTGLGAGGFAARDVKLTDDIVRAGINYKFDWGGPIVARY